MLLRLCCITVRTLLTVNATCIIAVDSESHLRLFEKLADTPPAVFRILSNYSNPFVPKIMLPDFLKPLMSLRQQYASVGYDELLALCESIILEIFDEMSKNFESYKVSHMFIAVRGI